MKKSNRRGMSILEVLIAASVSLGVITTLAGFSRFQSMLWQNESGDFSSQRQVQVALQRIAPAIREARSVVTASSGAGVLTLQLPAYDGAGAVIAPLQNGQVVSYYLSDTGGSPTVTGGTILWRSINGTPDPAWSLANGRGRVVLAPNGLKFTYAPTPADPSLPLDPDSVVLSVTGTITVGMDTSTFVTSQEVMLHNKGL